VHDSQASYAAQLELTTVLSVDRDVETPVPMNASLNRKVSKKVRETQRSPFTCRLTPDSSLPSRGSSTPKRRPGRIT
jgi:hypothetical protein